MELRALLDGARARRRRICTWSRVSRRGFGFRVSWCPLALPAVSAEALDALLRAILPAQAGAVYVTEFEADFAISVPGCGRFRVNAFQQDRGPGAVFR
jgi:Tfp pilus assembly pilus retraction ATPase PilT